MDTTKENQVRRRKRGGRKTRENKKKHFRIHGSSGRGRGSGGRVNLGRYVFFYILVYLCFINSVISYHLKEAEALVEVMVVEIESEVKSQVEAITG